MNEEEIFVCLPTEIILLIIHHIPDLRSFSSFALTCKSLSQLCLDERVLESKFKQLSKICKTNSIFFKNFTVVALPNIKLYQHPTYPFKFNEMQLEDLRHCTIFEFMELTLLHQFDYSFILSTYIIQFAPVEMLWIMWSCLEQIKKNENTNSKFDTALRRASTFLCNWLNVNYNYEWSTNLDFEVPYLLDVKKEKLNNNHYNNNNNNNNNNINDDHSEGNIILEEDEELFDIYSKTLLVNEFQRFYDEFYEIHSNDIRYNNELLQLFLKITNNTKEEDLSVDPVVDQIVEKIIDKVELKKNLEIDNWTSFLQFNLFEIPTSVFVYSITQIQLNLFSKIVPIQMFDRIYPNWGNSTELFLSWLMNNLRVYILSFTSAESRAFALLKIFDILVYSAYYTTVNNYSLSFCMYQLIIDPTIARLKESWKIIHLIYGEEKFKEALTLFERERNYSTIRRAMEKEYCIPHMEILLMDLLFISEGHPRAKDSEEYSILFRKNRLFSNTIEGFINRVRSSSKKYKSIINRDLIQSMEKAFNMFNMYGSGVLYAQSQRLEPRSSEKILTVDFRKDLFDELLSYLSIKKIKNRSLSHILQLDEIGLDEAIEIAISSFTILKSKVISKLTKFFNGIQDFWTDKLKTREGNTVSPNIYFNSFILPLQLRILIVLRSMCKKSSEFLPKLKFSGEHGSLFIYLDSELSSPRMQRL